MTTQQWLDRCPSSAYFAAMGFWKSLVIVVVVSLSYFFAHRYFPYVAIFGGLLWASQYFRSRGEADLSGAAAAFAAAADLIGIKRRPFQRSRFLAAKPRRRGSPVSRRCDLPAKPRRRRAQQPKRLQDWPLPPFRRARRSLLPHRNLLLPKPRSRQRARGLTRPCVSSSSWWLAYC